MDEVEVREFVDQAQASLEASPQMDEEATKFRLILPFIELLGWNTRSTEVEPEYSVRMATGKTKVDFALQLGDTPVVFIEAKPARSALSVDSIEQLRSYMRQELDVGWGVVTNGKSFEVLTKGDTGRQEEISLIQFDLDDLKERPDLLDILSKEHIQSGKSDEIAAQIAEAGNAIAHLKENKGNVVEKLNSALIKEISASVPLDTEEQLTEFVEDLISALEEQRRTIGVSSNSKEKVSMPEPSGTEDVSGDYIIKLQDNEDTVATVGGDNQTDAMAETVNYLVKNHDLIFKIEPMPYIPGREKAIINDSPTSPHDDEAMRVYRELTGGYYLDTHASKKTKKRTIERLVEECDLSVSFEREW